MSDCIQPGAIGKVGILRAGGAPPIWVSLPDSVLTVVKYEVDAASELRDPAALLARYYQEWETGTGSFAEPADKCSGTCYWDCYGCPALLFWTLSHFSDAYFPLTGRRKRDLILHTLEEASDVRDHNVHELMSTVTTDSLDYCWLFLVNLMSIEEELATRAGRKRAIERHLDLIYFHYGYLLDDLCNFHESGWITTASPKEDFERRLIDLGTVEPTLKPIAARIIRKWDSLEETGRYLRQVVEDRSSRLYEIEQQRAIRAKTARATGRAAFSAVGRQQLMRTLAAVQQVMTPDSDDDPAWHHPVEYIETLAKGRNVIFLDWIWTNSGSERLSNAQNFDLALLERMAQHGFRSWLFTEPEHGLYSIQEWLKANGEGRALKSLCDGVQQYMAMDGGTQRPSLRDVLFFPHAREPLAVTQEIRYWQEVWAVKERTGAVVRLYMAQHGNERESAIDWMRSRDDRRFIVIGDGGAFKGYSNAIGCTARDTSLVLNHRAASPRYEVSAKPFILTRALRFAAYQVGRNRGWGVHRSAVLPIKDNQRLLAVFQAGELRDESDALLCSFMVNTPGGYAEAVIYTADDEQEIAPGFEPYAVDSGAPLVEVGN